MNVFRSIFRIRGKDGQMKDVIAFKGNDGKSAYELAAANGFDGDEEAWLASLKGADGQDGQPGKDGANGVDGAAGKDGTSPTISVSEIAGGHRITITDVNGTKTVDVMDGADGQAGNNGSNGKDGNGIASAVLNADYTLTLNFDDGTTYVTPSIRGEKGDTGASITPLFANSIDECTDITKPYVLPDGYIYGYMKKTVNVTHNVNDGTGFINVRPTASTGTDKDANTTRNGLFTTAPIAIDNTWSDCVVNISGLEKLVPTFYGSLYVYYFDANGTFIAYNSQNLLGLSSTAEVELALPLSVDIAKANTNGVKYWTDAAYVRIAVGVKLSTAITTADVESLVINFERLNSTETTYGWYSTGHLFNTDDYGQAIEQNAADIEALQTDVETLKDAVGTFPTNSGAVWYAIGDSITKGYGVGAENCWVSYVMQYNGYDTDYSKNLGISGLGFAKADPNYSKTARTVVDENEFTGVDLVTIAIGINDWKEPYSIDTVKSEMGYCFEKILTDNPYCKIIFITPFNMRNKGSENTNWAFGYSGSDVADGKTLQEFINAQIEVCKQYGIQVINTDNCVINKKNITTLLYDGIHPDAECHKALGRELARRITFA